MDTYETWTPKEEIWTPIESCHLARKDQATPSDIARYYLRMSIYVSIVEPGRPPTIARTRAMIIPLVRPSQAEDGPLVIDPNPRDEPVVTLLATDIGWSIMDKRGMAREQYAYGGAAELVAPAGCSVVVFRAMDEFRGDKTLTSLLDSPVAKLRVRLRDHYRDFELRTGDSIAVGSEELPLPMRPFATVLRLVVEQESSITIEPVALVRVGCNELAGPVTLLPGLKPIQLSGEGWLVTLTTADSRLKLYENSRVCPSRGHHWRTETLRPSEG